MGAKAFSFRIFLPNRFSVVCVAPANPTATIDLENKGSVRISFKVKGTAVERYSVRPNRGLVQAKSKDKISCKSERG